MKRRADKQERIAGRSQTEENGMEPCIFRAVLMACLWALPAAAAAQSLSQTETIEYQDNLSAYVLGQVSKQSIDGVVASETTFDALARPLTRKAFGKLKATLTYYGGSDVTQRGTLASVSDGRDAAGFDTTLQISSWKRGIPQVIAYPITADQPTSRTVLSAVDDDGTIASATDENGYKTCYAYDAMGRLASVTYPSETANSVCGGSWNQTTQTFQLASAIHKGLPAGHWDQTVKTGNGYKVRHLDAFWRPVIEESYDNTNATQADATRSVLVKRYDSTGRLVFQSLPQRAVSDYSAVTVGTTTMYDALDRAIGTSIPSVDSTTGTFRTSLAYASDATGPYTTTKNARGYEMRTWFQMFDEPDYKRPTKIVQPEDVVIEIPRDTFGKPTAMFRRNGAGTTSAARTYTYNTYQELCRIVEPETGATLFGYDAAGDLAWSAAGLAAATVCDTEGDPSLVAERRVDRGYDGRGRLKTLTFPDHRGDITTTYTPDSLVASTTAHNDGSNLVTTAYTFNRRRLMVGERMTWGSISWPLAYDYDLNGNTSTFAYPDGTSIAYAPNALGQATQVGAYADNVTYHPNGAIAGFTYGNGIIHAMTQNDRQLPSRSRDAYSGATPVVALDDNYAYDGNANVMAVLDGITGAPTERDMTYDDIDRLLTTTSPVFGTATYSYDALDNLVHTSIGGPQARDHYYCYDAGWRLTFVRSGPTCTGAASPAMHALSYDVQGNLSSRDSVDYDFDYGNRLRSTTGTVGSAYIYDGLGRRVRDYTTGSKYSLYSQDGRVAYTNDARIGKATTNIYLGNSLLAEQEKIVATGVTTTRYLHTDALSSVAASSSAARGVTRSDYEPYGEPIAQSRNDLPGYAGHVQDAATGLTYMEQRYYDPGIGRFLSVDPVTADSATGSNFNRYWYANNNPYKFTDPDGRYTCEASICASIRMYVAKIRESRNNLQDRRDQRKVDQVLRGIGNEGSAGPKYKSGELKGDTVANTDQKGTTTVDPGKIDNPTTGGMAIGHEIRHDLDAQDRGRPANTSDEVRATETKAYDTEATIGKGLGVSISKKEQARGVEGSVKNWESRQKPPEIKK